MKNFAIIGVGGYIAPRHIQAINDTGNITVTAMDVNDSVGVLDRYTQDVAFFKDFERFEAYVDSLKGTDKKVDYVSICSPNHLHSAHMKFGLRSGCDVICEKPLVLNESEIDELKTYEKKYGKKINTVLQLRVHESIIELKKKIDQKKRSDHEIELTYLTSRGPWYHESWKGNFQKSGGLTSNIGIHFFDMLTWIFGSIKSNELHFSNELMTSGYMELEKAKVKWILSVDRKYLPKEATDKGMTTYRSITVDGDEIEFSGGFTDLHTKVYKEVIDGKGYGLEDARTAIRIVEDLRGQQPSGVKNNSHPMLKGL
ncbi:MAG: oxidoreductase [Halobacteriovoraceae bacterium]|nr:oxidoreductase [Halobacteriovoraceae bacterium]|tara:strand:+ start:285 stop:1223 length:939 start_codon:yes stop_codon:yes gene_type:complete